MPKTPYQLLNQPNVLQNLIQLTKSKVLNAKTLISHYIITDKFTSLDGSKGEKYQQLAKEHGMHPKSVQKIIIKMTQP